MASPFNKSNVFDLTHEHLATYKMGILYPNALFEVLPGDTIDLKSEAFSRFEAMIAPQMSNIDKYQYWFYCPNRIIFDDWEKYITGGKNGDDDTVKPYMVSPEGGYEVGSLADHLGVPTGVAGLKHSALPFRVYHKVYNEWFKDENMSVLIDTPTSSGLDTTTPVSLQRKCWEKDYFTNSLPTPQRGGSSYLPLGTSAPVAVYGNGKSMVLRGIDHNDNTLKSGIFVGGDDNWPNQIDPTHISGVTLADTEYPNSIGLKQDRPIGLGVSHNYGDTGVVGTADLTTASAVTINQLRVAFQVQKFMEKNMRGGYRLVEWTLSHFGVRIPDSRLQRTEFLGAKRFPVAISAVEQNSSTDSTSPQGNLAGRGIEHVNVNGFRKSFVEQGFVIGLVCYMPRTLYSQGLHRMWTRETRYDEYIPVFAHLGEQEVKNKEIYAQGTSEDEGTFGYQDRYNEFRHLPSSVHGQFRKGGSLNFWTLARQFDNLPQLNSGFVSCFPATRIFAVQKGTDYITAHYIHHIKAIRPLPKFGNPGLIDHD